MTFIVLSHGGEKKLSAAPGQTLLDALRAEAGLAPHAPCGGKGTCEKCIVYLVDGEGERSVLACQTTVSDGMTVRLPDKKALTVESGLARMPQVSPDPGLSGYGVACDLGTTTIVCHLVDLTDGKALATVGAGNEQRVYGADVIARIKASMEGKRRALTDTVTGQLSAMIAALCEKAGISVDEIRYMTLAGNTTMCHLLTGLPPDSLGVAPFTPVSLFGEEYPAGELGLPFDGEIYLPPSVSSYVGGDITADLLAAGADRSEAPVFLIDVGTNGEMALGCGEKFLCCSTAAGPAFEGAQIRFGMTAAEGAISEVLWENDALTVSVIGGGKAAGICGSGLIDAVAALLDMGVLDETGRLLEPDEDDDIPEAALGYLAELDGEPAVRLAEGIYVTQADIRRLQLGKGAIAAGVKVLLDGSGIPMGEIGALLLAGGFGSYIRPRSAARIGMIPEELLPVTRAAGNLAAQGAYLALLSAGDRERLAKLQKNMTYLELSGLAAFNDAYMDAMLFPEA